MIDFTPEWVRYTAQVNGNTNPKMMKDAHVHT